MGSSDARTALLATGLNAVATILPQVAALLLLTAADYGAYSMVYLVYAAGASSVFSVICDAWSRRSTRRPAIGWSYFAGALTVVSLPFGLVAAAVALIAGMGLLSIAAMLATSMLVFRAGSRYHETRAAQWRRVLIGDAAQSLGLLVGLACGLALRLEPMTIVMGSWAVSSCLAVVATATFGWRRVTSTVLRRWVGIHRHEIRPLLADSLLLDAGAIGTPYLVAPLLGLAPFGVYRAVSNVATPVQLILNPLRPMVTGSPLGRLVSARLLVPLALVLAFATVACYLVIMWIPTLPLRLGVISDLHVVALPASLFVLANGLSFYLYLVARGHAAPARIFRARVAQTILAVAAPVLGALVGGLTGAVWGFTGSAVLFVAVWWWAVMAPKASTEG